MRKKQKLLTESGGKSLANTSCRGRVLTSNDESISDNLLAPRLVSLDKGSPSLDERILKQEGHRARQLHDVLLGIGEARHGLALEDVVSILAHDIGEGGGTVADRGDGLACIEELDDELDRLDVGGEVEHGAVAARVEQGVVLVRLTEEFLDGPGLLPDLRLVLVEVLGGVIGLGEFD